MAVITGNGENNNIMGGLESDVIYGLGGNDILDGWNGLDTLYGGAGDDELNLGNEDIGYGENGNDTFIINYIGYPAEVHGGFGIDTLRDNGNNLSRVVITGIEVLAAYMVTLTAAQLAQFQLVTPNYAGNTSARVELSQGGTAAINLSATMSSTFHLLGSLQADIITFNAAHLGPILVEAGDGDDQITGAAGKDELTGGRGADILRGGGGNDVLIAGRSWAVTSGAIDGMVDRLFGDAGDDELHLASGDIGDGGAGNDTIFAETFATLIGGDGNDLLVSSRRLYSDVSADDLINGGSGIDTVSYETTLGSLIVDLALISAQNTINGGTDTITGIENLIGSTYSDTLRGNGGANFITGLSGDDLIDGRTGVDTASYSGANAVAIDLRIAGQQDTQGAGLDTLVSIENLLGSGNGDTLIGNAGTNVIEGGLGGDVIDGQGGIDTASYSETGQGVRVNLALTASQNTVGAGLDRLISIENLRGSSFNDTLIGNSATNRLEGGTGADSLDGGVGADVLVGGDGSDTYTVDNAGDVTTEMAGVFGTDTVRSTLSWTLAANVENLILTGSAAVSGTGNAGANRLSGNGAVNTLRDDAGGNDALNGLGGNDRLIAGAGDDVLTGGLGQDSLYGGAGADRFVFVTKADSLVGAADQLIGYSSGPAFEGAGIAGGDLIDLSGIDANESLAGNQTLVFASTQAIGTVRAIEVGSVTRIVGYVDTIQGVDFQIDIQDGAVLASRYAAVDFVL